MNKFSIDQEMARKIILDHYENPRSKIEDASFLKNDPKYIVGHKDSPSCIDNVNVFAKIQDNKIKDLKFAGVACAICTSSTDIMLQQLIDLDLNSAKVMINEYFKMINSQPYDANKIGDLIVYKNINKQLNRIKCATTGVEAARIAIENYEQKK